MFQSFVPSPHDVRALVKLAVPIVAMQVGMMLMSVVDTVFVGHVSARELAAAGSRAPSACETSGSTAHTTPSAKLNRPIV